MATVCDNELLRYPQMIFMLFVTLASSTILIFSMALHFLRVDSTSDQLLIDISVIGWTLSNIIPTVVAIYLASDIKDEVSLIL